MESELWGNGGVVRHKCRPDGFADKARELDINVERLRIHYQAGQATIYRWLSEVGMSKTRAMADKPPVDLAERVKVMKRDDLADHYGVGVRLVAKWTKLIGVKFKQATARPVPLDFTDNARVQTVWGLRKIYGCGEKTIDRWLAETGVKAQKYIPIPPISARRATRQKVKRNRVTTARMGKVQPVFHGKQSASNYDIAADTLRRERWIVYRCNDKGLAAEKGKFWRCGTLVLTPDELLAKAARYERMVA